MLRFTALNYAIGRVVRLLFAEEVSYATLTRERIYRELSDIILEDARRKLSKADEEVRPIVNEIQKKLTTKLTPEERSKINEELYTVTKHALENVKIFPEAIENLARSYTGKYPLLTTFASAFRVNSEYNKRILEKALSKNPRISQLIDEIITAKHDEEKRFLYHELEGAFKSAIDAMPSNISFVPESKSKESKSERKEREQSYIDEIWNYYIIASRNLGVLLTQAGIDLKDLDRHMREYLGQIRIDNVQNRADEFKKKIKTELYNYLRNKVDDKKLKEILNAFGQELLNINKEPNPEKLLRDIGLQVLLNSPSKDTQNFFSWGLAGFTKPPEIFSNIYRKLIPTVKALPDRLATNTFFLRLIFYLNVMHTVELKRFLEILSSNNELTPEIKKKIGLSDIMEKLIKQPLEKFKSEDVIRRTIEKDPNIPQSQKQQKIEQVLNSETTLEQIIKPLGDIFNKIENLPADDPFKQEFLKHMISYIQKPNYINDLLSAERTNKELDHVIESYKSRSRGRSVKTTGEPFEGFMSKVNDKSLFSPGNISLSAIGDIPLTLSPKDITKLIVKETSEQLGEKRSQIPESKILYVVSRNLEDLKKDYGYVTIGNFFSEFFEFDLRDVFERSGNPLDEFEVRDILKAVIDNIAKQIYDKHNIAEKAISFMVGELRKYLIRLKGVPDSIRTDIRSLVEAFVTKGAQGAWDYLYSKGVDDGELRQKILNNYLIPAANQFAELESKKRKLF